MGEVAEQWTGGRRWVVLGLVLGVLGLSAWTARWVLQSGLVVWTDLARAFWVPDSTLGWVETSGRWVWLGLDGLAITGAVVVSTLSIHLIARKLMTGADRGRGLAKVLSATALIGAGLSALAPVLPAWAFISGFPPSGAERLLPVAPVATATPVDPERAVAPLPVPAGRWGVAPVAANVLIARIDAGGESFDAKLSPVTGEVRLDPTALLGSSAKLAVPSASLDTGVAMRNGHAREYLAVEQHPSIALVVPSLDSVEGDGTTRRFKAAAELSLMGQAIPVTVTGTLAILSDAQRKELGVGGKEALLVSASFTLSIAKTSLDREDFDADQITLTARLVLVPEGGLPAAGPPK